jgi:hypothetical protein
LILLFRFTEIPLKKFLTRGLFYGEAFEVGYLLPTSADGVQVNSVKFVSGRVLGILEGFFALGAGEGHIPSQKDRIKLESFLGIQKIILRRSVRAVIFIGVVFFLATIFSITFITTKGYSPFYLLGFVVLINISVISFCSYISSRSRKEYQQIPHAIDGRGAHRCIFCGNRGIYKHGQYKSNSTWHDCSNCGENLYMS